MFVHAGCCGPNVTSLICLFAGLLFPCLSKTSLKVLQLRNSVEWHETVFLASWSECIFQKMFSCTRKERRMVKHFGFIVVEREGSTIICILLTWSLLCLSLLL